MARVRPGSFSPALALALTSHLIPASYESVVSRVAESAGRIQGPGFSLNPQRPVDAHNGIAFALHPVSELKWAPSVNVFPQNPSSCKAFAPWNGRLALAGRLRSRIHSLDPQQSILNARMSGNGQADQTVLFVGNLPWAMDSYGLRKVFETCGEVVTAQISFDNRNDRSRGFGHVVFKNRKDAEKAIRSMNNREVGGRFIQVYVSNAPRGARSNPAQGRVDMQAMRVNPAAEGSRYAQPSKEKMAYRYARDWVASDFQERLSDPELNLAEDDWHPVEIIDDDAELDWSSYLLRSDKWNPDTQEVEFGHEEFVPVYQGESIDWDMDFNADPQQFFGDGTVHMVADPARPVIEDFDRIFIENDQRTMEELRQQRKNGTIIDASKEYQVATRAKDQYSRLGRGRRDGTNIVDPFGKRNVRRGLRERANAQNKAILERMKEQAELLQRTLTEVERDPGEQERRGRRDYYDDRRRSPSPSRSRMGARRGGGGYRQSPPPRYDSPPPRTEEPPPPYGAPRLAQRRRAPAPSQLSQPPQAAPNPDPPAAPSKPPAKRRGRPPKSAAAAPGAPASPAAPAKRAAKKASAKAKAAAPKKAAAKKSAPSASGAEDPPKRKRGRPRKNPLPEASDTVSDSE